jgi:hypothetical protein
MTVRGGESCDSMAMRGCPQNDGYLVKYDFGYLRVIMYIVHISALCGANIRAEVMCAGWLQEDLNERVFSGEDESFAASRASGLLSLSLATTRQAFLKNCQMHQSTVMLTVKGFCLSTRTTHC